MVIIKQSCLHVKTNCVCQITGEVWESEPAASSTPVRSTEKLSLSDTFWCLLRPDCLPRLVHKLENDFFIWVRSHRLLLLEGHQHVRIGIMPCMTKPTILTTQRVFQCFEHAKYHEHFPLDWLGSKWSHLIVWQYLRLSKESNLPVCSIFLHVAIPFAGTAAALAI